MRRQKKFINQLFSEEQRLKKSTDFWQNFHPPFYNHPFWYKSLVISNIFHQLDLLLFDPEKYAKIKYILTLAGFFLSLMVVFLNSQLLNGLVSLLIILAFTFFAFHLIDIYLLDQLANRKFAIFAQIPEFFDLLNLYTHSKAYSNFGQAILEVSKSMSGILAQELNYIGKMYRFLSLEELLNLLEDRIKDALIEELCTTILLTFEYGGSVASKITLLTKEAHVSRIQRAKEAGNIAAGALLIPLLIFHLPVLLIIFLVPSILAFSQGL